MKDFFNLGYAMHYIMIDVDSGIPFDKAFKNYNNEYFNNELTEKEYKKCINKYYEITHNRYIDKLMKGVK